MALKTSKIGLVACLAIATASVAFASDRPANVDHARMIAADSEPGQWMGPGRTYGEDRYSPLKQINDANVQNISLAWYADISTNRGVEASPLMIDGIL